VLGGNRGSVRGPSFDSRNHSSVPRNMNNLRVMSFFIARKIIHYMHIFIAMFLPMIRLYDKLDKFKNTMGMSLFGEKDVDRSI